MAVLGETDRSGLWADFMAELSAERNVMSGITKADLRAAVDALDDFLNTNAGAINSAIPQPARAALTTPQKARLLVAVVRRRYIAGA